MAYTVWARWWIHSDGPPDPIKGGEKEREKKEGEEEEADF